MTIDEVHALLRHRKSVFPPDYLPQPIADEVLWQLLENANRAPSHKLTEPWRFKVIKGAALKRFGNFMAEKYRAVEPMASFSISKYEKLKTNPQRAGAVVAICLRRDPKERVPEWEEVAAVAMAVQNMWITAAAYGLGAYWSTPELMIHFPEFCPLDEGERCIGLFYIGYTTPNSKPTPKGPIADKVVWLDQ